MPRLPSKSKPLFLVIGFLIICLLFFFLSQRGRKTSVNTTNQPSPTSQTSTTSVASQIEQWTTYQNKYFQIQHPAAWRVSETPIAYMQVTLFLSSTALYQKGNIIVTISVSTNDKDKPSVKADLYKKSGLTQSIATVGRIPALKLSGPTAVGTPNSKQTIPAYITTYLFSNGDTNFEIQEQYGGTERIAANEDLFSQMVNTFRVVSGQ